MTDTVLVTGGAGYVGSHACKALSAAGFEPVAYDNFSHGHRWAVKWGPAEQGDIADRERLAAVLRRYKPVAAMHFAGLISAGESVTNPAAHYRVNVLGSWSLLDALRAADVRDIVFSSSAAVYGHCALPCIPETAPLQPANPYGFTKLGVERMLADYARAYGLRSIALRYFNAAGADPAGELGEVHEPETHLIPLVLQAAAGARSHVDIYGDDYATPDGTCVRDYVHVTDLAEAHVAALRRLRRTPPGRDGLASVFNLGTGQGHSVKQVVESAQRVTGCPIRADVQRRRAGDPAFLVADPSLAARELDWAPRFGSLDAMLESAWRWLRKKSH